MASPIHIDRRLRALAPATLEAIQVAAVAGQQVRVDLLTRVQRLSVVEVLRLLTEAAEAAVVVETDGDFAFRDQREREAAIATLPPSAVAALHAEVADHLAALGASTDELIEHQAQAAAPVERVAVGHLATAAAEVVGAAPAVALRLLDVAAALAPADDIARRVTRVEALAGCGRIAEAESLGTEILDGRPDPPVVAQVGRALALTAFIDGRPADALDRMQRVADAATGDRAVARSRAELAWASMLALDSASSRADATAAIALAHVVDDHDALITARSVLTWIDLWAGDVAAADENVDALADLLAAATGGAWQSVQPWMAIAACRLDLERYDEAVAATETGRRRAVDTGSGWAVPAYEALAADALLRAGHLGEAAHRARAAIDSSALIDGFGIEVWARVVLAQCLAAAGRAEEAATEVAAADVVLHTGRAQFGIDQLLLLQARAKESAGDADGAHADYRAGWELFGALGLPYLLPSFAPGLARTAALTGSGGALASEATAMAAESADRTRVGTLALYAAQAAAWIDGDPSCCRALAAAADASRRPLAAIDAWRDLAAIEHRAGRRPEAAAAEARADEMATRVRAGAPRPAPATRPARPHFGVDALTPTERQVAVLLADGLSHSQIAAEMVLSRRAVDDHVLAAHRKLEVTSRADLVHRMREVHG